LKRQRVSTASVLGASSFGWFGIAPSAIRPNLGDDPGQRLHLFVIRVLDNDPLYEVMLSGEEKHQTVKSSEWLPLLHDTLARLLARIIYARKTSKA